MGAGMRFMKWLAVFFVVLGAIAWGAYGITAWFGTPFLLVNWLVFGSEFWANLIYVIIGLLGLVMIPLLFTGKK